MTHRVQHFALTRISSRSVRRVVAGLGLLVERLVRNACGIQIDARAHIGPGLMFTHEGGIVIGPVRIGRCATISQGVTLGRGMVDDDGPGYADTPVLGDRVWVGPGTVIAGRVTVGSDAAVGANSVVLRDVSAGAVVLGVPARLISRKGSFQQVSYRGMDEDPDRQAALAAGAPDPGTTATGAAPATAAPTTASAPRAQTPNGLPCHGGPPPSRTTT